MPGCLFLWLRAGLCGDGPEPVARFAQEGGIADSEGAAGTARAALSYTHNNASQWRATT